MQTPVGKGRFELSDYKPLGMETLGSVERPQTTTIFSPSQTLKKNRFARKQSHDCSIESIENLYTLRKVS